MIKPKFITFTGIDKRTDFDRVIDLSIAYPVEWGILFSKNRQGRENRYPDLEAIRPLLSSPQLHERLRLSAHICGAWTRNIMERNAPIEIEDFISGGFGRTQINGHSNAATGPAQEFAKRIRADQAILQCRREFPSGQGGADWLFDQSGGMGKAPKSWDAFAWRSGAFCGYAGGIGPDSVVDDLKAISKVHPAEKPFWIDMEGNIRTDDWLDLDKCEAVLRAVYG